MKLRRIIAAALTLALGLSLSGSALAAEAADARLTKVTQTVKTTLQVGDEYEAFYGEPSETMLGTQWSLEWSTENKSLSVTATEAGKVLSMSLWENLPYESGGDYGPSFPPLTVSEGRTKAEAFLDRVLTQGEEAVLDEISEVGSLNSDSYRYSGAVNLNGLPSPLRFSLRVRVSDGAVTSFWRGDVSEYVGDLPAAETSTTADKAAELLKDTLSLRLEYVLDDEGGKAVLRYLPNATHDFYVDAATGKLVDLTELREKLSRGETGGSGSRNDMLAFAPEAAEDASLSKAELEGIAKLEGTLDQEALDEKVRAWKQLGLDGFELAYATYQVEREDGGVRPLPIAVTNEPVAEAAEGSEEAAGADAKVTAYLTYVKKVGDGISRRTVTLDAKTGELQSMSGYNAYDETPGKTSKSAAQKQGEAFLKALWGDQFGKCALYSSTEAETRLSSEVWVFTYAQKVNGYFFPANSITVRVSAADGSIMGFSKGFDDAVVFDDAEGLVSEEAAIAAWAKSFPVELSYITVPVELDLLGPIAKPLISAGYSYYNALKPGYQLGEQDAWYTGVDAKTGELVKPDYGYTMPTMTYDDVEGHWAQAALTELAEYNVGWFGGKADPDGALTQLSYLALLAGSDGYAVDLSAEGAADELYDYAIRRGLLTAEERADDKALTRGEMVKLLLDSLGFKQVANLKGIFRCDFTDADAIPTDLLGYAALAQGLGIISGDGHLNFAAESAATRAEAAVMLWRYMKR